MGLLDLLQSAQQPLAYPIAPQAQIAALQADRQVQGAQEVARQQAMRAQQQALQLQLRAAQQDAQRFLQEMQERQQALGQRKRQAAMAPALESLDIAGQVGGPEAAAATLRGVQPQLSRFGVNVAPFQTPRERAQAELAPQGGVQGLLQRLGGMTRGQDPLAAALQVGTAAAPFAGALKTMGAELPDYGQILGAQAQRQAGREHLGAQLAGQRMSQQSQILQQQIQAQAQILDQIITDYGLDRRKLWELNQKGATDASKAELDALKLVDSRLKAMGLGINPQTGKVEKTLDYWRGQSQAKARVGKGEWMGKSLGPTVGGFGVQREKDLGAHERLRGLLKLQQRATNDKTLPPAVREAAKQDAASLQREIRSLEERSGLTSRGMLPSQQAAQTAVAGRQTKAQQIAFLQNILKNLAVDIRQMRGQIASSQTTTKPSPERLAEAEANYRAVTALLSQMTGLR